MSPTIPSHMLTDTEGRGRRRKSPPLAPIRGMVCPACEVAWDSIDPKVGTKCWMCEGTGTIGSIYTLRMLTRDSDPVSLPASPH